MKQTILIAMALGAAGVVFAAPTTSVIKPRLHGIEVPSEKRNGTEMVKRIKAKAVEKPAGRFDFGDEAPAPARIEAQKKTKQLNEIVTTQDGVEIARQRFEYFDNGLSHLRINEYREGNGWNPVEEYGYEWDEDGYCTAQWGRTYDGMSGSKNEFTYNDRKLGIEKLISNYIDGEWVPSEKGEYSYDEYGNINEEVISMYEQEKGMWTPIMRNCATWDALGHQTSYETYSWDGNDWIPSDDRATYDYDALGNVIRYGFEMWDGDKWVYYYRIRQNFDNGLIILQTNEFWNPDEKDWVGCYAWKGWPLYSTWTDMIYDQNGKQIATRTYKIDDLEQGWVKTGDTYFYYTPLEDGAERVRRDMYLYQKGDFIYDILTKDYNSEGFLLYTHEKMDILDTGNPIDIFEETYRYVDKKYLSFGETYQYSQDAANIKTAEAREEYDFDENYNVIESRHELGKYLNTGEGDFEDFQKVSKFTYGYENNVRTEKLAYMWNGNDYVTNWGEGIEYDFTIPAEECIVWQELKMDYTILKTMSYTGDGATGWNDMTFTYNYQDIDSGIDEIADSNCRISFSPNPVTDVMHITADGEVSTQIYDLSGSLVLSGEGNELSLASLAPGMYLARINGKAFRVVKR